MVRCAVILRAAKPVMLRAAKPVMLRAAKPVMLREVAVRSTQGAA
jgi:hypothetical protein